MQEVLSDEMKEIIDIDPLFGLLEGATLGLFGDEGYQVGMRVGARHTRVGVAYIHSYQVAKNLLGETYKSGSELSEMQQGNTVLYGGLLRRIFYNATMVFLEEYPDNTFELMLDEHENRLDLESCIVTNHLNDTMWKRSTEFIKSDGFQQLTESMDFATELVSVLLGKVIGYCERFAKKSRTLELHIDYENGEAFDAHLCKLYETQTPIFAGLKNDISEEKMTHFRDEVCSLVTEERQGSRSQGGN